MTNEQVRQLVGAVGGAFVVAGVSFFAVYAATDETRALVSATGSAFFGHLAVVFGVARMQRPVKP